MFYVYHTNMYFHNVHFMYSDIRLVNSLSFSFTVVMFLLCWCPLLSIWLSAFWHTLNRGFLQVFSIVTRKFINLSLTAVWRFQVHSDQKPSAQDRRMLLVLPGLSLTMSVARGKSGADLTTWRVQTFPCPFVEWFDLHSVEIPPCIYGSCNY